MAKKVFKGLLPKNFNIKKCNDIKSMFWNIDAVSAKQKSLWVPEEWPPVKVTVTVEVEND